MSQSETKLSRTRLEQAIDDLIRNQRGIDFQRIALQLARQIRPDIVANEIAQDGGEDGVLANLRIDGNSALAIACSITATWGKIHQDLDRIKSRRPQLSGLWFYTPQRVTTRTSDEWKAKARERFGVELTVFSREDLVSRLLEPRNRHLAHHHLGLPMAHLSALVTGPAFASRIGAFFDTYLSAEVGPVPFGGRDRELAQLDAWLIDDQASSRCLVTAPAGRGKSALLVRWVERLRTQGLLDENGQSRTGAWQLVFVPISMRFGISAQHVVYQALAERLAIVAGEGLESCAADPSGFYADKARELLMALARVGTRVLVILDGLDEVLRGDFDATIFPRVLPSTVRVLVSARWLSGDSDFAGWRQRLDWLAPIRCLSIELGRLDEAAIKEVLLAMGAPIDAISKDRVLLARLAQLTEGEPLVLSCYATELWSKGSDVARLRVADLDQMQPGFVAYFDFWLRLQENAWRAADEAVNRHDVDSVLMILAFAHAPLEATELMILVSKLPGGRRTPVPQRLLEPLRRFVIGDGSAKHGYVLSHPRIGEHLRAERYAAAKDLVEDAFVRWGRQLVAEVNRHGTTTVRVPPYLLQFYRAHLQVIDAPTADFLALVEDGWRRAWESYEGSERGFSSDVRAVLDVIRRRAAVGQLGAQLRCVLALSSIRSLGHNVPASLITACVERKILSIMQALHLAGFMKDRVEHVETVAVLATRYEHDPGRKRELLGNALEAAKAILDERVRAHALCKLSKYLAGDKRLDVVRGALAAIREIPEEADQADALVLLARALAEDELSIVTTTATSLKSPSNRASVFVSLRHRLRSGELSAGLAAVKEIDEERTRADALIKLADRLEGQQLSEALAVAKAISYGAARKNALCGLAPYLTDEQVIDALDAASAIEDKSYRVEALVGLLGERTMSEGHTRPKMLMERAMELTGDRDVEALIEAFQTAEAIRAQNVRAHRLIELTQVLEDDLSDDTLRAAVVETKAVGDEEARAAALSAIAVHLKGKSRRETLHEAFDAARKISDERSRAVALIQMAPCVAGDQQQAVLDEILATAKAIEEDDHRALVLRALARCAGRTLPAEALETAKAIKTESHRASALAEIAGYISGEQLQNVLAAARSIGGHEHRAGVLVRLARRFRGKQRIETQRAALAAFKVVDRDWIHCPAEDSALLSELAAQSSGKELAEVFAAARALKNEETRALALIGVARHLRGKQRRSALREALATTEIIDDEDDRAGLFIGIASLLNGRERSRLLALAHEASEEIWIEPFRVEVLCKLADQLAGGKRSEVLAEAIAVAKTMQSLRERAFTLSELAGRFGGEARREAFNAMLDALSAIDVEERPEVTVEIARSWNGSERYAVLSRGNSAAGVMRPEDAMARVHSVIASGLPDAQMQWAFADLLTIGERLTRSELLQAICPLIPVLFNVGGEALLLELRRAINETADWYP